MAAKKAARKRAPRARKVEARSRGLAPGECPGALPEELGPTLEAIRSAGGALVGSYRDPLAGQWMALAALPIERVAPTPFQRDLSEAHAKRLATTIEKLGRFLDPIIAVPMDGAFWTPNGRHRLEAMTRLGARAIMALVLPDPAVQYAILALNVEKAHGLREKSLEVIRMYRAMARDDASLESAHAFEFEEPSFATLGACYENNGRFAGSAYQPILRRVDAWLDEPLPAALRVRETRAARVEELDGHVSRAVKALQERGFKSPYLKTFVVARVNTLRFMKTMPAFDDALDDVLKRAARFDVGKVKQEDISASGGGPADDD